MTIRTDVVICGLFALLLTIEAAEAISERKYWGAGILLAIVLLQALVGHTILNRRQ